MKNLNSYSKMANTSYGKSIVKIRKQSSWMYVPLWQHFVLSEDGEIGPWVEYWLKSRCSPERVDLSQVNQCIGSSDFGELLRMSLHFQTFICFIFWVKLHQHYPFIRNSFNWPCMVCFCSSEFSNWKNWKVFKSFSSYYYFFN